MISLFIGEWALRSVGVLSESPSTLQYIGTGFFVQISNTLSCILKLTKDGFDYQALILTRNLIDIAYTLLTLLIDKESRDNFLEAARNSDEKTIWYKYFRFERMEKVVWKYLCSIGDEEEIAFLKNWGSANYHWLSAFVHNDLLNISLYAFSKPKDEEEKLSMNLQGHYATRISQILKRVIEIMFFVDMLFAKILSDKQIDISKEDFCTESEGKKLWDQATAIYLVSNKYFIALKREEGKETYV